MSDTPAPTGAKSLPVKQAGAPGFLVSSAPHLASGATTQRIMFEVVFAMLPLLVMAIYFFRVYAVTLTLATVAGCLVAEAIANAMRGQRQSSLADGSAIVTGMILAFSLPPMMGGWPNIYMAFIGGMISIGLAKAVFGGLGHNLFNPAMVGRAFLMVCFPAAMGLWTEPVSLHRVGDPDVDGVTQATPLGVATEMTAADKARANAAEAYAAAESESAQADAEAAKEKALTNREDAQERLPSLGKLAVGNVAGCVGETSALAALIGGLWLVFRRVADWRQPLALLITATIVAALANWIAPERFAGPLFHLTSGALIFGAFFIATDYVGAPVNPTGRLIFGAGVGLLIMVIRLFGAYPEGVMFAILIMNSLTPVIERMTTPKPFGGHVAA